jgi:hypothetical protein
MSKYKKLLGEVTEHRSTSMTQDIFNIPQLEAMKQLLTDRSAETMKTLSPLISTHRSAITVGTQINNIISKLYTGLRAVPKKSVDVTNHALSMVDRIINEKATASVSDLQIIYNDLESAHYVLQSEESSFESEKRILNLIRRDTMAMNVLGDIERAEIETQVENLDKVDIKLLVNCIGMADLTLQSEDVKLTFIAIENFHMDLSKSVSGSEVSVNDTEFQSAARVFRCLWLYLGGCVLLARNTNALNPDETDIDTIGILRTSVKNLATAEERLLGRVTFEDPAADSLVSYISSKLSDPETFYSKVEDICKIHSGILKSFESAGYPTSKVYTASRIDDIDLTVTAFDPALYKLKKTPYARQLAAATARKFGRGAKAAGSSAYGMTTAAASGAYGMTTKAASGAYDLGAKAASGGYDLGTKALEATGGVLGAGAVSATALGLRGAAAIDTRLRTEAGYVGTLPKKLSKAAKREKTKFDDMLAQFKRSREEDKKYQKDNKQRDELALLIKAKARKEHLNTPAEKLKIAKVIGKQSRDTLEELKKSGKLDFIGPMVGLDGQADPGMGTFEGRKELETLQNLQGVLLEEGRELARVKEFHAEFGDPIPYLGQRQLAEWKKEWKVNQALIDKLIALGNPKRRRKHK